LDVQFAWHETSLSRRDFGNVRIGAQSYSFREKSLDGDERDRPGRVLQSGAGI